MKYSKKIVKSSTSPARKRRRSRRRNVQGSQQQRGHREMKIEVVNKPKEPEEDAEKRKIYFFTLHEGSFLYYISSLICIADILINGCAYKISRIEVTFSIDF